MRATRNADGTVTSGGGVRGMKVSDEELARNHALVFGDIRRELLPPTGSTSPFHPTEIHPSSAAPLGSPWRRNGWRCS